MIPTACKRLAEVDFPIATVSRHAAKEKSIRFGHPSTLHLWWARRPLAACRAILLGLLLPDPADPNCPSEFKLKARDALARLPGKLGPTDLDLRKALLQFIGAFANWDLAANAQYLAAGRDLVRAAHPHETPLVVDPFAGGGSIPLEALRLGCDAFASDLNPVAALIQKVMLEDIPRYGPALIKELSRVGAKIQNSAEKELAEFYPADPDGARPMAYLWARTVRCEADGCGAEIPLVRSFWLSKKKKRKRALRYRVLREPGKTPRLEFEIFEPTTDSDVPSSTVSRANATCPSCSRPASPTVLPLRCGTTEHQLILGRRGTGKTHLLRFFQYQKQTSGQVVHYCDCTRLGSGLHNSSAQPLAVATKYFVALLQELSDMLLEHTIRLENPAPGIQDRILSRLSDGFSVVTNDTEDGAQSIFNYQKIATSFESILADLEISRLFIVVDEWAQIPLAAQPYVAELIKRAILTVPTISLKIVAVNYLSRASASACGSTFGPRL